MDIIRSRGEILESESDIKDIGALLDNTRTFEQLFKWLKPLATEHTPNAKVKIDDREFKLKDVLLAFDQWELYVANEENLHRLNADRTLLDKYLDTPFSATGLLHNNDRLLRVAKLCANAYLDSRNQTIGKPDETTSSLSSHGV